MQSKPVIPHKKPFPDLSGWSTESAHAVPALQLPQRAALQTDVVLLTSGCAWNAATCMVVCCSEYVRGLKRRLSMLTVCTGMEGPVGSM